MSIAKTVLYADRTGPVSFIYKNTEHRTVIVLVWNEFRADRSVTVIDDVPPVITLNGDTINYQSYDMIEETLKYDFQEEKMQKRGLPLDVQHEALENALWQEAKRKGL